jgi:DNA-binding LytR/AlgR family response regulator
MKTYNCVVIDDNISSQEILREYISRLPNLNLKIVFKNAIEALDSVQKHLPEILFIDVEMPHLSGLDFLKSLKVIPPSIITSAHTSYAKDSFDVGVVDFLHKPFSFERFLLAINRVTSLHIHQEEVYKKSEEKKDNIIFFKSGTQLNKVQIDNVVFIEAFGNYTKFHLISGSVELMTESMTSIEQKLPKDNFLKIHKSYIIFKKWVTAVRKKSILMDKIELPIGDTFRAILFDYLLIDNQKLID